jgi:hypothetical protein
MKQSNEIDKNGCKFFDVLPSVGNAQFYTIGRTHSAKQVRQKCNANERMTTQHIANVPLMFGEDPLFCKLADTLGAPIYINPIISQKYLSLPTGKH